jgi:hypothetical protein
MGLSCMMILDFPLIRAIMSKHLRFFIDTLTAFTNVVALYHSFIFGRAEVNVSSCGLDGIENWFWLNFFLFSSDKQF